MYSEQRILNDILEFLVMHAGVTNLLDHKRMTVSVGCGTGKQPVPLLISGVSASMNMKEPVLIARQLDN
jgi:hypothetical protein